MHLSSVSAEPGTLEAAVTPASRGTMQIHFYRDVIPAKLIGQLLI